MVVQILAGLLLVPLTIVVLLLLNIYVNRLGYILFLQVFAAVYALLWNVIIPGSVTIVFAVLVSLYLIRAFLVSRSLKNKIRAKNVMRCRVRDVKKKFYMFFTFPFSFLRFLKILPGAGNKKVGHEITLANLVDVILQNSAGTKLEVSDRGVDLYFEIL